MSSVTGHGLVATALMFVALSAPSARAGDVTLYRCVDAKGAIAVQDQPCPKDAQQTVLKMARPIDAPLRPQKIVAVQAPPLEVHVVSDRYPQPVWECTNAQTGETYLSDSGTPQSRYVSSWMYGVTGGFAVHGELTPSQALHPPPPLRPPNQPPPPPQQPPHHDRHGHFLGGPAYAYVQDSCVRLQQNEVCEHLRDRDDVLRKLIFNSQPDERVQYEREQKGLRQQLREDCG
jgi:hypothetical protein